MNTSPFSIQTYTGGSAQTNAYLLQLDHQSILIDAPEGVFDWIKKRKVNVQHVLLTHQHYDHVMDAALLQQAGAVLYAHQAYQAELTLEPLLKAAGYPIQITPYRVDHLLNLSEVLSLAGLEFQLSHVPGHSTDSITYYLSKQAALFSGDTLFQGSIGRTDLPHGSHSQLIQGIREHLLSLPKETKIFPGHGGASTIELEKRNNPFL